MNKRGRPMKIKKTEEKNLDSYKDIETIKYEEITPIENTEKEEPIELIEEVKAEEDLLTPVNEVFYNSEREDSCDDETLEDMRQTKKVIELSIDAINSFPTPNVTDLNTAGREMYRLLAYIAHHFTPCKVLCLSHDTNFNAIIRELGNGIVEDFTGDFTLIDNSYEFIVVDLHPHEGGLEKSIYEKCKRIDYKGFIIYDDTELNDEMKSFINEIPNNEKIDVTKYGHWSGTTIVNFNEMVTFVCD